MEQHEFLRQKAVEKIKIADHMLFTTYPIVKDPKLLLAVLENINAGLEYAVASILHFQRSKGKIPAFEETYETRMSIFKAKVAPQLGLSQNYVKLISDVKNLLSAHKKSPVAFAKKDKYVILSPKYDVTSIDVSIVKRQVFEAKLFLSNIAIIVNRNERIVI